MSSSAVLMATDLSAGYERGVPIVRGATIKIAAGEIVAVLGPNGAGKSTLIKAIVGLVPKFSGTVLLDGADITALAAHDMVRHG
ncbi:MAG: ATP-binding cassette domain-containing protein, partial [Pseudomonadota bacterium]|nr:ATP-binding cassette domain-containing protein [Pseudomonadota bacterium]